MTFSVRCLPDVFKSHFTFVSLYNHDLSLIRVTYPHEHRQCFYFVGTNVQHHEKNRSRDGLIRALNDCIQL